MQLRERSIVFGMQQMSDEELLAILLRNGSKVHSALEVSKMILHKYQNLKNLHDLSLNEWCQEKGIGEVKALMIMASFELGRRANSPALSNRITIKSSKDAFEFLENSFRNLQQEHFKILMLNTKNYLIGVETISIGSLNSSIVHPRELFKSAIKKSAASIILAHNHPSGVVDPSEEDVLVTKRIKEGGKLLGIDVLDHLIIGETGYFSFKEETMI